MLDTGFVQYGRMISFSSNKAYKPSLFFLVGDAIADGSALKTNYVDKYHGLTEKDLEKMSVKELEEHENEMAEHNTMHIVEDVCQRINDEPGSGGCFMQAFITNRQSKFSFVQMSFGSPQKQTSPKSQPIYTDAEFSGLIFQC